MGEKERRGPDGYRRWSRYGAYGSAGAAIAIAVLMAASPLAGALKPHFIAPPYKGTAATISKDMSISGNCKTSGTLSGMHWVPKTGNETGFANAAAKGCSVVPTGAGSASVYNEGIIGVAFPVKVYTNTGHNFSVAWSYDYTVLAALTGTPSCPVAKPVPGTYTYSDCSLDVSAGSEMEMELYDQTNNSYLYGGHDYVSGAENYSDAYNYSYCTSTGSCYNYNYSYHCTNSIYYYANCVPSGTMATGANTTYINSGSNCDDFYAGHCYYWYNWTLNTSHKYWVLTTMYFYADAYIYGYSAGHTATASVNGGTLGNTGWKITSVTVT